MSGGLDALLAGARPAGVYLWPGSDPAADADRVRAAGWSAYRLDGHGVSTKSAFLALAGRVLGAGDDFGLNLDALWDVLRDLDDRVVMIWDGWGDLATADPAGFGAILEVLQTRAVETAAKGGVRGNTDGPEGSLPGFSALLCGPGPELSVLDLSIPELS